MEEIKNSLEDKLYKSYVDIDQMRRSYKQISERMSAEDLPACFEPIIHPLYFMEIEEALNDAAAAIEAAYKELLKRL